MATSPRKSARSRPAPSEPVHPEPGAVHAPPHNIWLAGLGALASAQANAQAEGTKAFEALVQQGLQMQARTQALAKEQWSEAAQRMGALTTDSTGAAGSWDRLGGIFEGRVARALASLGMPAASEVAELRQRVAALEQALAALQPAPPKTPAPASRGAGRKSGSTP